MKTIFRFLKTLAACFLFLANTVATAQPVTFEKTIQPDFYSSFTHTTSAPGGHWIAAGSYFDLSSFFFTPGYVSSFDSSGNTDWQFTFVDTGETITVTDLIKTNDDQYFITGYQRYCDFGDITCYMKKFDASGITSWTKLKLLYSYSLYRDPVATQMESGTYVLGIDTLLHFANETGDSLRDVGFANGVIYSLQENFNHQIAIGSEHGLTIIDTNGIQLNFIPYASGINKIVQREDSSLLVLSGRKIFMLDTSFAIADSVDLSLDFTSVNTMKYELGKLWILGKNATSPLSKVMSIDSAGTVSPVLILSDSAVIANDLAIDSSHIFLSGKENTGNANHMYAGTFLHNGTHNTYTTDAGVINVRFDSTWAVYAGGPPQNNATYFDTYVTVKNFGTDTLRDVYVNAKLWGFSPCGAHPYYEYHFTGIALAPSDTFEFHCGVLGEYHWCLGLCTFSECFWTSCPDSITDQNHLNDSACAPFTVNIIDGVPIFNNPGTSFIIIPNPFSESFSISFSDHNQNGVLKLYNSIGKKIMERNVSDQETTISTQELPPGIYLALVETESGTFARKIIKE